MTITRIIVADQQSTVRSALRLLLEQNPAYRLVGEATCDEELLTVLHQTETDLLLLDWHLPGQRGEQLLAEVQAHHPDLPVVILSGRPEMEEQALCAGASAFISKGDPPECLIATLAQLSRHKNDS